jgi:hypothetical protein
MDKKKAFALLDEITCDVADGIRNSDSKTVTQHFECQGAAIVSLGHVMIAIIEELEEDE